MNRFASLLFVATCIFLTQSLPAAAACEDETSSEGIKQCVTSEAMDRCSDSCSTEEASTFTSRRAHTACFRREALAILSDLGWGGGYGDALAGGAEAALCNSDCTCEFSGHAGVAYVCTRVNATSIEECESYSRDDEGARCKTRNCPIRTCKVLCD